jgi:hypothetical protein
LWVNKALTRTNKEASIFFQWLPIVATKHALCQKISSFNILVLQIQMGDELHRLDRV